MAGTILPQLNIRPTLVKYRPRSPGLLVGREQFLHVAIDLGLVEQLQRLVEEGKRAVAPSVLVGCRVLIGVCAHEAKEHVVRQGQTSGQVRISTPIKDSALRLAPRKCPSAAGLSRERPLLRPHGGGHAGIGRGGGCSGALAGLAEEEVCSLS